MAIDNITIVHIRRFNSNFIRLGDDECWIWQGAPSQGYGRLRVGDISYGSHVIAWELHNGRNVTPGMFILHSCNNKLCVNPLHLSEGTNEDNMKQAWNDGLMNTSKGEEHYNSQKTHCPLGHPYEGYNLVYKKGRRCCRECGNRQYREYIQRKRSVGVT